MTSEYMRKLIAGLGQWTACMSYNDTYFGEPPGFLKQTIRQMVKEIEAEDRANSVTVTAAEVYQEQQDDEHRAMVATLGRPLTEEEKAFYASLIGKDLP